MSQSRSSSSAAFSQYSQRLKSFRSLLDPTDLLPGHNVADLYSLRHLCLQGGGIPDTTSNSADGWLRAQAWRVLLGYMTPEKSEWSRLLEKRRAEYYQFVRDFLPQNGSTSQQGIPGKLSERDALLDQIYRDLSRSRKNAFAFYRDEVKPSSNCPLTPLPTSTKQVQPRIASRHSLLERLELINEDYAYSLKEERQLHPLTIVETSIIQTSARTMEDELLPATLSRLELDGMEEKSPSITLQPASPQSRQASTPDLHSGDSDGDSNFASADEGDHAVEDSNLTADSRQTYTDRRWHSLLRILYIYALLNPSIGYVQGMNEVLFVLLYVMGSTGHLPSVNKSEESVQTNGNHTHDDAFLSSADDGSSFHYQDLSDESPGSHAEADAFWCFSALVGDIRDLYDFDGLEHAGLKIVNRRQAETGPSQVIGMASALKKFSLRLKWLDEELWKQLRHHSLDPRLPYFSFRWLACMVSTELTLPSVVRVWDAILAESGGSASISSEGSSTPKVEFLIDVCCALLINIRAPILTALDEGDLREEGIEVEDSFGRAMKILQAYPDDDVGPVIEMACLYRQRRLAAPLTGQGPPSEDEDESLLSVRERAASALRTWTNSSTPSRASKWLSNSPRTPSTPFNQPENSTPSRTSSATLFKRYTEAIQSSDAAANLSKASTNFTAKAMATWSGDRSNKDGQQSSPLASIKTSLVNRVLSGGTLTSSTSTEEAKQVHPSLRWSVQSMPPSLPLPNVNDSPPGRFDSSSFYQSPQRGYNSANRLGSNSLMGHQDYQIQSPDLNYVDSTPGTSPSSNSIAKFGVLPVTPRSKGRTGGPKPLLLTGSARPPREGNVSGSLSVDEPMSRKVSSGPLAANINPQTRRKPYSSSRRDSSYAGSVSSSAADHDSVGNDGTEESASVKGDTLSLLPSLQAAKDFLPSIPSSVGPMGLQGSGHGTGLGTVPASAFNKIRVTSAGQDARDANANRPQFGQVASSADVPLASKVTLQRKPKRKDSETTNGLASPTGDGQEGPFSSSRRESVASSSSSRRFRRSSSNTQQSSVGTDAFEHPRQAPAIPNTLDAEIGVQKYSLTDEPTVVHPTKASLPNRSGSSSSTRSMGVTRSKRAYSSGKKTRKSLTQASGGTATHEASNSGDLVNRGGRESVRMGTIDPGTPSLDVDSGMSADSVAPELFSPKVAEAEMGRLLPADELLSRLQLDQGYSGGESSGFEDETGPPALPDKKDTSISVSRLTPSYLSRDASSEEDYLVNSQKMRAKGPKQTHEEYTTEDMAAIGSALAFADGVDEEEDEGSKDERHHLRPKAGPAF